MSYREDDSDVYRDDECSCCELLRRECERLRVENERLRALAARLGAPDAETA